MNEQLTEAGLIRRAMTKMGVGKTTMRSSAGAVGMQHDFIVKKGQEAIKKLGKEILRIQDPDSRAKALEYMQILKVDVGKASVQQSVKKGKTPDLSTLDDKQKKELMSLLKMNESITRKTKKRKVLTEMDDATFQELKAAIQQDPAGKFATSVKSELSGQKQQEQPAVEKPAAPGAPAQPAAGGMEQTLKQQGINLRGFTIERLKQLQQQLKAQGLVEQFGVLAGDEHLQAQEQASQRKAVGQKKAADPTRRATAQFKGQQRQPQAKINNAVFVISNLIKQNPNAKKEIGTLIATIIQEKEKEEEQGEIRAAHGIPMGMPMESITAKMNRWKKTLSEESVKKYARKRRRKVRG